MTEGNLTDLIIYDADHRVSICCEHGTAIRNLERYLRGEHIGSSLEQRKFILNLRQHDDYVSPTALQPSTDLISPIAGLRVPIVAQPCYGCECHTILVNEVQLAQHSNTAGGRLKPSPCIISSCFWANSHLASPKLV